MAAVSSSCALLFSSTALTLNHFRSQARAVVTLSSSAPLKSHSSLSSSSSYVTPPHPHHHPFPFPFPLLLGGNSIASASVLVLHAIVSADYSVDLDLQQQDVQEGEKDEYEVEEEEVSFSPHLKLFVGNLPFTVDSAILARLFGRAGNVEMVEVIYDKGTGRSRGFGFVTMSTLEEVEAAAQQLNGYELEGRRLRVNYGPPPRKDEFPSRESQSGGGLDVTNRIYVGNLSWGVDDLALETLFSEHGKVLEAKVIYDRESGRSRGFGFVTYNSAKEVSSAISSLNGIELGGRAIRVTMAEAKPKRHF